ncbi:hypothetical protein GGI21_002533 [Coemansia aciculifera]|uniref:Uncharacterized protein n=1 Tax=Coemansia aciculifera TaxID=417176 RepID=A0ACC1M5I9_9FUNG|nr:hypothetical protein IWW38_001727 [Coemansia aciculifera]KAJ2908788.1 hypothetical protein GGI21_002533 [Coemansia aciculifera]
MEALVRDCDKLAKHQSASLNKTLGSLDALLLALESNRDDLDAVQRQCRQTQEQMTEQLRELSTNVAKYGKHVERTFKLDLGVVAESRAFENKRSELAQAITLHFLRTGDLALARSFNSNGELEDYERFEEMNKVAEEVGVEHRLDSALEWAAANRTRLSELGLGLEFSLHRLRFLQLVEEGSAGLALEYGRRWFGATGGDRLDEVTRLMGVLMYARRPADSPYAGLFAGDRWVGGAREFASAFCAVTGQASASPLAVSVAAGARALAVVGKASSLLRERRVEWSQADELAVEVVLPPDMRFHSVFACPVSKEQASAENPPMALPCGHVVCKASLDKLARGARPGAATVVASGRFKCPYCPGLATAGDADRVHF